MRRCAIVFALLTIRFSNAETAEVDAPSKPNVVLIIVDTLRADRVTANCNGVPVMPRLRERGETGWRFDNAYAQSSWTKPSVTSILTGLYPGTHGLNSGMHTALSKPGAAHSEAVPLEKELAAEFFKRNGYFNMCVQTNRLLRPADGYARGFDCYIEAKNTGAQPVTAEIYKEGGKLVPPFFLYMHYMDPHAPYNPPEAHRNVFGRYPEITLDEQSAIANSKTSQAYYLDQALFGAHLRNQRETPTLTDGGRRYVEQLYDADCNYTDTQMDRLIQALSKRFSNTIFVITADHGEELWDHGSLGHGRTLYQELTHVPLIFLIPNAGPRVISTAVQAIDLLPTIAALAGLEPNPAWQGRSLAVNDLREEAVYSETKSIFPEAGIALESIIHEGKKLVRGKNGGTGLFDLTTDPHEQHDISDEAAGLKASLEGLLDAHNVACAAHPLARVPPLQSAFDAETQDKLNALGYLGKGK